MSAQVIDVTEFPARLVRERLAVALLVSGGNMSRAVGAVADVMVAEAQALGWSVQAQDGILRTIAAVGADVVIDGMQSRRQAREDRSAF